MDEFLKSKILAQNIEVSVSSEEHIFFREEVFKHLDPETEYQIKNKEREKRYRPLWNDRKNSGLMTDIAPGIPYTNEMVDNGKLSFKQKRELDSIKKTLIKDFKKGMNKSDLERMTKEQWDSINSQVDFIANAKVLSNERNKRRNTRLKQLMKLNKVKDVSELPQEVLTNFSMEQRFWMDDIEEDSKTTRNLKKELKIREFVESYVFDRNIIEHFNREYIFNHFSKALKELNEIKGVAEYLKLYPETEMKQKITWKEAEEFANQCDRLFKCEMTTLGYKFEENELTKNTELDTITPVNDNQIRSDATQRIRYIVGDANRALDDETLEKELNIKFSWLSVAEYEQYVSKEHKETFDKMKDNKYEVFSTDYSRRAIVCAYYNAQLEYLDQEIKKLQVDYKSIARKAVIGDKIKEIKEKKFRVTEEMKLIYEVSEKVAKNQKLSFKEENYITSRMDSERKIHFCDSIINVYTNVQRSEIEDNKEDVVLEKAKTLADKIYKDMDISELMDMQKELYETQKLLKKIDKEKLSVTDVHIINKIDIMASRARTAAIYYCNQHMKNGMYLSNMLSSLTEEEKQAINSQYSEINSDTIEKYALRQMNVALNNYDSEMSEYINSPQIRSLFSEQYNKTHTEGAHTEEDYNKLVTEHKEVFNKFMGMPKNIAAVKAIYDSNKAKLASGNLTEEERTEAEKEMKYAEIINKLYIEKFYISGNKDNKVNGRSTRGDRLVRGMWGIEKIPEFASMNDDEMFEMMSKLSAGVFEETNETYRAMNLEGLAIFKKKLLKHYKNLYLKYGLRIREADWYVMNQEECFNDFAESQPHDYLRAEPDHFNMEDADDRLLYALIGFYRPMIATYDSSTSGLKNNGRVDANGAYNSMRREWANQNVKEHLLYLKEHESELREEKKGEQK